MHRQCHGHTHKSAHTGKLTGLPWHHCPHKGTCGDGYCEHLAEMLVSQPLLELGQLHLPRNSRTLVYGHSYLRQVWDNFLVARPPDSTRQMAFDRWHEPAGDDNGTWHEKFSVSYGKSVANPWGGPKQSTDHAHGRCGKAITNEIREVKWQRLNTTIVYAINTPVLQDPESIGELTRFLTIVGRFDAVVFMAPHGTAFNEYLARKDGGKSTGGSRPVDLGAMTTKGRIFDNDELATLFRAAADTVVQVIPWRSPKVWGEKLLEAAPSDVRSMRPSKSGGRIPMRANQERLQGVNNVTHTMVLDEYVHAALGNRTPFSRPNCGDGKGGRLRGRPQACSLKNSDGSYSGHQCQPGALTLAAVDLNNILKRALGRPD